MAKIKSHTLHCVLHLEPTCQFYETQEVSFSTPVANHVT